MGKGWSGKQWLDLHPSIHYITTQKGEFGSYASYESYVSYESYESYDSYEGAVEIGASGV